MWREVGRNHENTVVMSRILKNKNFKFKKNKIKNKSFFVPPNLDS